MGDVGRPLRYIESEPLPTTEPVHEPSPESVPTEQPVEEPVPV